MNLIIRSGDDDDNINLSAGFVVSLTLDSIRLMWLTFTAIVKWVIR